MPSAKTRPTTQRPWPRNAEWARRDTYGNLAEIRVLLDEALNTLEKGNWLLLEAQLLRMKTYVSDSQRILTEARIGTEPGIDGSDDHE